MAIEVFFGKVRLEEVIGTFEERERMLLLPLPHPSVVRRWLNDPAQLRRQLQAVEQLSVWRVTHEL